MVKGDIIYYKKVEVYDTEFYYSIIKTENGEYYVKSEVLRFYNVTPTLQRVWSSEIRCLKIKPDEVEKITRLLEKGIEAFEEQYRNKDWIDC